MRNLRHRWLYGILDLSYIDVLNVVPVTHAMIAGGVDLIQLRGKTHSIEKLTELAAQIHRITSKDDVPLIINDHPAISRSVVLEGVHVGQDDVSISQVRASTGRNVIVGKSTHTFEQAVAAQDEGADYIGFGPVFVTPTKPDYLPIGLESIRKVHETVQIPIFCIGGIKLNNLARVIAAGAQRVVIVSELLQSENIEEYAKAAKAILLNAPSSIANRKSQQ